MLLRVVMDGNRLDLWASVDLDRLKKLRAILEKYEGISALLNTV
jgi:hypothetical protein